MRILDFTDGFSSNSAPSQGSIQQNSLAVFASDAAFVVAKGSAAALGDMYSNSTTTQVRYFDGTQWEDLVGQTSISVGINHIDNSTGDNTSFWDTFKDAAAAVPVDGTGGVSTLTFVASSSSPLRGSFSFLLTKGAANLQGEGVSTNFTIDPADVNKRLLLSFDYEAAGSFVSGTDSDIGIWIYDVTNSTLITPQNISLLASNGEFSTTFLATSSLSYRLIFFCRTTSALAYSLKFDNVIVSPQALTVGSAPISDWISFTPTGTWTTNTTYEGMYRRVGSDMELDYRLTLAGAPTGGNLILNMPTGFTIDSTKLVGGSFTTAYTGICGAVLDAAPAAEYPIVGRPSTNTTITPYVVKENANTWVTSDSIGATSPITFASGDRVHVKMKVPVSQWDSNVVLSNSKTIAMSSLLQFGTRVTATPTALGQYRTLIKSAAALTSTDDAPATSPTAADGMRIYGNANFASAGTAGQTNKWVIYVGPGRIVQVRFFSSAGKTGHANGDYSQETTLIARGALWDYDPATGLVVVDCIEQSSTTTTRNAGYSHTISTTAPSNLTNMYFEVLVSDTPVPMDVSHASTHIIGGIDPTDADRLGIDFVPANYTRTTVGGLTTFAGELTSHLKGIDLKFGATTTIANSTVSDTGTFSTTSATYVVVTSMTLTPVAGTYLVLFDTSAAVSNNGNDADFAIHLNGVEQTNTTRPFIYDNGGQERNSIAIHAIITTPGAQAIDVRARISANTLTVYQRTLTVVRVA
jgi:hypothetical protein